MCKHEQETVAVCTRTVSVNMCKHGQETVAVCTRTVNKFDNVMYISYVTLCECVCA